MIYIYRRAFSEGGRDLADALNDAGTPARYTQGGLLREERILGRLREGRDRLVCWGENYPVEGIAHVLNQQAIATKHADAVRLTNTGVATIEVSQTRPVVQPERPAFVLPGGAIREQVARQLVADLQQWLVQPLPPAQTWLGRRNNHIGGSDLLAPPQRPDYWVKKENIAHEYRLHMFRGKSIRAGRKIQREVRPDGNPSHPWIRSFDAGWIIAYDGFESTREQRTLCANATQALGLDFGAVDLAQRADGSLFVLEVNRAPGLEGGSLTAYVGAIQKWLRGEE